MSPTLDAFLSSWVFDPWLLIALLVSAGIYLRGWLVLRRRNPPRWHGGHLAAFFGGLTVIYLALGSPIEPFAALLLQVHMLQHLLLMMVAPPLLWLGAPFFPLLRGLPRSIRVFWAIPLLSAPSLRRLFGRLTHPLTALLLFIAFGFSLGHGNAANLTASGPVRPTGWLLALIPVMFTYSGWNAAAYVAEEVRNPGRNVPLALALGTGAVIVIYLLLNAVYLFVLPANELAQVKESL